MTDSSKPLPFRGPRSSPAAFLIHPLLFAVAPAFFIFSHNIEQAIFFDFMAPALACVASALALLLLLLPVLGDRNRAALVLSTFLILFFSFGPVHDCLKDFRWGPVSPSDPWLLGLLEGALFIGVVLTSFFLQKQLPTVTRFLNVMAAAWISLCLINILGYELRTVTAYHVPSQAPAVKNIKQPVRKPDVYYLIFDTYAREDILKERYGYDNGWFIKGLENLGFYVASKSLANYAFTALSIGSALNMSYLDDYVRQAKDRKDGLRLITELNHQNKVMAVFKQLGYTTVAFSSGYPATNFTKSDIYVEYRHGKSEFREILLEMTPLRWFTVFNPVIGEAEVQRRHVLYGLKKIPGIAKMSEPTFTFVHFFPPRFPFIFGKDGEPIDQGDARALLGKGRNPKYPKLYRDHVQFISKKILQLIKEIFAHYGPGERPIIILQGDHGPDLGVDYEHPSAEALRERFAILNAYYLPGQEKPPLDDSISPVNSFRVVLDHYFGEDLPRLEDRCYFSKRSELGPFEDVTEKIHLNLPENHASK